MRALAGRRLVKFRYRSASGKSKDRELAPLDFLFFRGQPYVIGVDHSSLTIKGFKVARILSVPTVGEEVSAPDDALLAAARSWVPSGHEQDDDVITVRLRTSPGYARVLVAQFGAGIEVLEDDEGLVAMALEFDHPLSARRSVLSMGDHVWNVRPKHLRDELLEWLKDVGRGDHDVATPTFSTATSRRDTLGQTLQLIAAVYQAPEPIRASQLAERCGLDIALVRSVMSRVMSLQFVRNPTQYLVDIELGEDTGDDDADDPLYAKSAAYDAGLGASVGPLTWRDAFELLVALKEVEELYPSDVGRSVVEKIERTVNAHVRVMEVSLEHLSVVRDAIDRHEQLKISYWTPSRDEVTDRWVQPRAMASRNGRWYFRAYCATRKSWLTFRVDRILHVHAIGPAERPPSDHVLNWADEGADEGAVAVVAIPANQRWIVESLPIDGWTELDDDRIAVRLHVRDERFLDQLMVDAGPGAAVLEGPREAGRELARRMIRQL
jgi:proteasome accessory factor C